MKETPGTTSVDGEDFSSALKNGCLYSKPDGTPFQRSLGHIRARDAQIMAGPRGENYEQYDETNTVNTA